MICQNCNREIEEAKFCPYCGKKQQPAKSKDKKTIFKIVIVALALLVIGGGISIILVKKKEQPQSRIVNVYQLMNGGKDNWKSAESKTTLYQEDGNVSESITMFYEADIEEMRRNIRYDTHGNVIGYVMNFGDTDKIIKKDIDFDLYEGGMSLTIHSDSDVGDSETKGKYVYNYDIAGKIVSIDIYELGNIEQYVGCIDLLYDDKGNVIRAITYGQNAELVEERWIDYDDQGRKKKYTVNNQYRVAQLDHAQTITEYNYGED